MIVISLNTEVFQATMADFSRRLGIALPKVVAFEGKMLLAEVIKWTPPFNNGDESVAGMGARKIGQTAVRRDVVRAIYPLQESKWREQSVKKAIAERNSAALVSILNRSKGNVRNAVFRAFAPAVHKNSRDALGRVKRSKGVFTFDARDELNYINKVKSRVGMAKGSWAAAFIAMGGRLPAWVTNAAAQSKGSPSVFVNNLSDPVNPSISITSQALGVRGNTKLQKQIRFSSEVRSKAMASKARRMMSDPIKHANLFEQYK